MPLPRKKSCAQCRGAKTRCDLDNPRCARCVSRGVRCDYGNTQTSLKWRVRVRRDKQQFGFAQSTPPESGGREQPASAQASAENSIPEAEEAFISQSSVFNGLENEPILDVPIEKDLLPQPLTSQPASSWWLPQSNNNLRTSSHVDTPFTTATQLGGDDSLPWLQQANEMGPNGTGASPLIQTTFEASRYLPANSPLATIMNSPPPSLDWSPWRVVPRTRAGLLLPKKTPNITPSQMLAAKFILGTMTSWPPMLIGSKPLPPFVHPKLATKKDDDRDCSDEAAKLHLPTPLAICTGLLQMYYRKTPANTSFVWRTIFAEQERSYREKDKYDRPHLLSALQAIAIYILLQAHEGQHDERQCVILLLTMGEISTKLYAHGDGYYSSAEARGAVLNWGEWAYVESIRRTAIVLFLINVLLDIDIGYFEQDDCKGMDWAPLPAGREVWEAREQKTWEGAYTKWKDGRRVKGPLRIGVLREAQGHGKEEVAPAQMEELGRWSEGLDGFGAMVLMTAVMAGGEH